MLFGAFLSHALWAQAAGHDPKSGDERLRWGAGGGALTLWPFALGTGIAGVAGWAMTLIGNVVPNMGQTYIVDSFLVVVTGGVGKLLGTISAGLGIGIFNKMLEPLFEAVYGKVILLGLIIVFLQSRPTGLFPAKGRSAEL